MQTLVAFLRHRFASVRIWALALALPLSLLLAACGRANLGDELGTPTTSDGGTTDGGGDDSDAGTLPDTGGDTIVPPDGTTVVALQVAPTDATIPVGGSVSFTARALFSDGSSADVTTSSTWIVDNPAVATVASAGTVNGVGAGRAKVQATYFGFSAAAALSVVPTGSGKLTIAPATTTIDIGASQTFVATYIAPSGAATDVTSSATWSSSSPSAAFGTPGVLIAKTAGSGTVTASYAGLTATASFTVNAAKLVSIQVSPTDPSAGVGVTVPFTATGIYSDGSKSDLTATASWTSGTTAIATISSTGVATTVGPGVTVITASSGGISGSTNLTVTSATLVSITVSPASATISVGGTATFTATALYSDGSKIDVTTTAVWTSDTTSVATVASGVVTGVSPGLANVKASFGGQSGTAAITVSAVKLVSITISPANPTTPIGTNVSFTAKGTYADGSTRDITSSVTWSVGDTTVAGISNAAGSNGVATPIKAGSTSVTATLGAISGSTMLTVSGATVTSITVSPNPLNLTAGLKGNVTATAIYSDGSKVDVTKTCTWTTTDGTIATVSNVSGAQGLVTAVASGTTTVTCTIGTVSGSASIVVAAPSITSITVSPIAPTCHIGDTIQLQAVAISSGGTSQNVTGIASWSVSPSGILTPTGRPGRYTCTASGTATVTATYSGVSGSTTVTVNAATITSLQIDPVDISLAAGATQQYQCVAIFSDGTSQNVTGTATFTSSNTTVAGITTGGRGGRGLATALAAGTTTIACTDAGLSASTTLTVTSAVPVSISVEPIDRRVAAGTRLNYSAQVIYSDGTSRDITALATWLSSDTTVAQISDARGSRGAATALAAGTTTISAIYSGLTGSTSLTVTSATVTSIQVTPFIDTVAAGMPVQYRAVAIYSDGTSSDVTGASTWTSTDTSVAAVSDAAGSKGRATTIGKGTTTISAQYAGVVGTAMLTVSGATLTTIQITPFRPSLPVGYGIFLTATGIYSDGSTADLTGLATWTSSATGAASVSDAAGSKGHVVPIAPGTATLSAAWAGVTGSDVVTVTSAKLVSIAITPNPATVAVGSSTQLTAAGTFSDGTKLDITEYATWISSAPATADVTNTAGTRGTLYGFATGAVTITAQSSGVKGTTSATVK